MLKRVKVVSHDPSWAQQFKLEAAAICAVFKQQLIDIYHIGSTAIPQIKAKPIIDILAVVQDIHTVEQFNPALVQLGYEPLGDFGIPGRRFFAKGGDFDRTHNLHIFQIGHQEIEYCLNFRDYLIAHPEEATTYSRLKEELAQRFPKDINGYLAGKNDFIKDTIKKAKAWRTALSKQSSS
ncbi:MAG: GrpB family protein [Mojavia pulchra JT2-VF2]|uniref:GrpB family protein n=1 Tax=Mojavia pulchra JT2-VF2 TaxID=287848 RepID=A0A951UIY6_9NOST|nr:GrpB family protein [Mojavia pulchra JT2-VF2]